MWSSDPLTWQPIARAIRATAPTGTRGSALRASVHPDPRRGVTSTVFDDSVPRAPSTAPTPVSVELDALRTGVRAPHEVAVTVQGDGGFEVRWFEWTDRVASCAGSPFGMIVLRPDSVPEIGRRLPESFDRPTHPSADAGVVKEAVRWRSSDPLDEDALRAHVRVMTGAEPTDELVAWVARAQRCESENATLRLGSSAWKGQLIAYGLRPDLREAELRGARNWTTAMREVIEPDPRGMVQPLAHTPRWWAIGEDYTPDLYAVDLAPGERGFHGQVLRRPSHHQFAVEVYAPSLAAFLTWDPEKLRAWRTEYDISLPDPRTSRRTASFTRTALASRRDPRDVDEVLESVSVWNTPPVDLSSLRGLPRLRSLAAAPGTVRAPGAIKDLPALEWASFGVDDWMKVLAHGAIPPSLLAARIDSSKDPRVLAPFEVARRLIAGAGSDARLDVGSACGRM